MLKRTKGALSKSEVGDFLDSDVEVDHYVHPAFDPDENDLEIDKFDGLKKKLKSSKKNFLMPLEKNDKNSFFNSIFYTVSYILTQEKTACVESEMREDLPEISIIRYLR